MKTLIKQQTRPKTRTLPESLSARHVVLGPARVRISAHLVLPGPSFDLSTYSPLSLFILASKQKVPVVPRLETLHGTDFLFTYLDSQLGTLFLGI